MAIFDIGDLGTFDLGGGFTDWGDSGGAIPGIFNLGGPASNLSGYNFDTPSSNWYNWNAPTPAPDTSNWWTNLSNFATEAAPVWQMATGIGNTALQLWEAKQKADYQSAMEDYTKQMGDYWTNKQAMEKAYNDQVMAYLAAKQEWESGMAGMLTEGIGGFQEQNQAFQDQLAGIIESTLGESTAFFEQSQELLEPAIASLAKGEVPPELAPVLDQLKAKARAAAMQAYASAGIDASTAEASIFPTVDAMATEQLIKYATAMLGGGVDLGKLALTGAGTAMQGAGTGAQAMNQELALLMQAMNSLYGGFPSLAGGGGGSPPPPAAPMA